MTFPCSSCGACCRRIGLYLDRLKEMGFPYGVKKGTNECEKLTLCGKCEVYNNRPDVCNIDKMYYLVHAEKGKTKEEVFKIEAEICNEFIREDELNEKYLIDMSQFK